MAKTDKRDASGKFAKGHAGGPGRPPGMPNRGTIDARVARERLLGTWDDVGGDARLVEFAKKNDRNYREYLRLYCGLLPKETMADVNVQQDMRADFWSRVGGDDPQQGRDDFHERLVARADGGPITSETVQSELEAQRNERLGIQPGGNGRAPTTESDHGRKNRSDQLPDA